MRSVPVILDVDPGRDDAVAILLACGVPELDVRAVTTVAGNVPLQKTTANALKVLSFVGRMGIPVEAGAEGPLNAYVGVGLDRGAFFGVLYRSLKRLGG